VQVGAALLFCRPLLRAVVFEYPRHMVYGRHAGIVQQQGLCQFHPGRTRLRAQGRVQHRIDAAWQAMPWLALTTKADALLICIGKAKVTEVSGANRPAASFKIWPPCCLGVVNSAIVFTVIPCIGAWPKLNSSFATAGEHIHMSI
jgi:hypothetical protein